MRIGVAGPLKIAVAGVLMGAVLGAVPAGAQIYRWTDSSGVVHLTTNPQSIPESYRAEVRAIDASRPPGERPAQPAPAAGTVSIAGGAPIIVTAHLNGVPLTLMVDTGADRTMLAPAALARSGLQIAAGRPVRVHGVAGVGDGYEVTLPRLDVAGARLGPITVVVHDVPSARMDGLLGRDLLPAFTLTVDAASGQATLTPR